MVRKYSWLGIGLLLLAGCYTTVRPEVDGLVCTSAGRPVDCQLPEPAVLKSASNKTNAAEKEIDATSNQVLQAGAQEAAPGTVPLKKMPDLRERLTPPPGLPGADVPPIKLPVRTQVTKEAFDAAVSKYFPPLPNIGPDPLAVPGPDGHPLTLSDLQKLARTNSPVLRQAAADVAAARGAAVQAGAYANPIFGVQSNTNGPSGGPNYGVLLGQTISTMGKKKLAEAAAIMDLENAQLAYQRAQTDLMTTIRTGYFAVLVAQEAMKANRALVNLTDEVYKVNVDQVGGGEAAPYEPFQVAVFAAQARQGLIVARNSYTLAWKQLAANIGIRGMPPTMLAGRLDIPLPHFEYDSVLGQVLTKHTDVATAVNAQKKARYNLRLAEVTAVPDVTVQTTISNDNTLGSSNRVIAGLQATIPVPVWDRNLGAIQQNRGALMRAVEEEHRVRNDLTARVSEAFRRYDENRDLLELYRRDILPKQVLAFRAAVTRHHIGEIGKVAYTDLIASEQNLVSVIGPYIAALGAQWQAVVDVAALLQTEDIFQTCGVFPVAPIPNLDQLLCLPCCHPCSPVPNSVMNENADHWPKAGFTAPAPATLTAPTPLPAPTPVPAPTPKSKTDSEQSRASAPRPARIAVIQIPDLDGEPLLPRPSADLTEQKAR